MSAATLDVMRKVTSDFHTNNGDIFRALTNTNEALDALIPSGTMRKWFEANNGKHVTTVQCNSTSAWAPNHRVIDASHSTYVELDYSRRDYAGLRVLHAEPNLLIVDGESETIAYAIDWDDRA